MLIEEWRQFPVFELGLSVTDWLMAESYIEKNDDVMTVPSCSELSNAVIITNTIPIPVDPTSSVACLGPQIPLPQD